LSPIGVAAQIAVRQDAMGKASSKLRNKVVINGWKDCGRSFGRSSINPSPCYVFGYPKQMAVNVH
jgi:hypothetical protein